MAEEVTTSEEAEEEKEEQPEDVSLVPIWSRWCGVGGGN